MIYNFFTDGTVEVVSNDIESIYQGNYPIGTFQYDAHDDWDTDSKWWYQSEKGIRGFNIAKSTNTQIPNEIKAKLLLLRGNHG